MSAPVIYCSSIFQSSIPLSRLPGDARISSSFTFSIDKHSESVYIPPAHPIKKIHREILDTLIHSSGLATAPSSGSSSVSLSLLILAHRRQALLKLSTYLGDPSTSRDPHFIQAPLLLRSRGPCDTYSRDPAVLTLTANIFSFPEPNKTPLRRFLLRLFLLFFCIFL